MNRQKKNAIEAVARHVSATWEQGNDSCDAYLKLAGKRVGADLKVLQHGFRARPRLRFDKVVIRLMETLKAALGEIVPDGSAVLVTVTAPIRVAGKTAVSLEQEIRAMLRRAPRRDRHEMVQGNRVRIRILKHNHTGVPKLIGFVHNPETDAAALLDVTTEWIEIFAIRSGATGGWC